MVRSRLNQQLKEKSMHTIVMSIVGSIIIIILLVLFGVPALIKLGGALQSNSDTGSTTATDSTALISPPFLDPLVSATNSASITVSGSATGKYTIRLYNNDTFIKEATSKDDGSFSFRNVTLKDGDNAIKVVAKSSDGKNQSKDSGTLHVVYSNKEPALSIDYPSDGSAFKDNKTLTVRGKTDSDAQVTVNGFQAIVDSNGGYSYTFQLHDGGNDIAVITTNSAGNKKAQTIHVTYN